MNFLSPKNRIALGMTGAVVAVVCLARLAGYIPDRNTLLNSSRSDLAEAVALGSSLLIMTQDVEGLDSFLTGVETRNRDVQSFGVRKVDGELVMEVGEHHDHWQQIEGDYSQSSQIQVPIYESKDQKWGTVEMRFTDRSAGISGIITTIGAEQVFFIGSSCFLLFNFFLGMVLKHLDPSKAVPQRVRDALDNLAEGLLIIDTQNNVLLANTAFANVLGQDAEKLIGKKASKLGFETTGDAPWEVALRDKRLVSNERVSWVAASGQRLKYHVNCSPLLGHKGNYCGVMVTFDDVTQLEESRVQLKEARDAADAANQAKSDFLANMSHEIRTPMNAILGFTDVLRRGMEENPDQRMEYLNTIHSSGSHLIELINEILDLSKVEAGKLELEIREFELPELLHHVVQIMSSKAEQKGVGLGFNVTGRIPSRINSDSTRVKQILINLVGNAVKFTEQGEVRLDCSFQSGTIRFDVTDTGIGMSREQMEKIFDPFSQADSSVTRRFGGTGLGLSICKKFAEALNGSISVSSQPNVGTTFSVQIPIESSHAELLDFDGCKQQIQRSLQSLSKDNKKKLNESVIMVVDDGETNRNIVSVVLKRHGQKIIEAENGQQACEIMATHHVDAILMDMQMPVMDGYTATRLLRKQGFTLPIVALTGNAMEADEIKSREAGCTGLLPKPIDIDLLIETLGKFIGFSDQDVESGAGQSDSSVQESSCLVECSDQVLSWSSTLPMEDPEFRAIVETFVGSLPRRLDGMLEMLTSEDWPQLQDEAHWLKGAAGTVGLGRLTEPASLLEESAGENDGPACRQQLISIVQLVSAIELNADDTAVTTC